MNPTRFALLVAAILTVASPGRSPAQTFTRVTDPTNPVVADRWQSGGGCFVDLVGDGYLDLFVANGNLSNEPNALYRNLRPGGFVKVVTSPVVTDGGSSIGGTFGDYDNDGRLDLFVTNRNFFGNFLYHGLGDTVFAKVTGIPVVTDVGNSNSSSWVDVDRDGFVDLYVVNFQQADYFYHSDGAPGGAFTRIDTVAATPGTEFSIPSVWADYDGDGFDDLFVGNAGSQNDYLYANHGGLFLTRTVIADGLSTLGASWGDYDNDGHFDLLAAHYSNQVNTLYHNSGPPGFALTPVAGPVSSEAGFWVGSAWGDYDNDGNLDLLVARDGGASSLFHNGGPPSYALTKVLTGPIATDVGNAFGAVWGDYDRDGQLDLFIADRAALGNRLYHNDGNANHWLTARCQGTTSNRAGIGARVRVLATIAGSPRWQCREVTSQTGYNSGNLDQHFGLGDAPVIDSLVVAWPSGQVDTWTQVVPDTFLVLVEGSSTVAVAPGTPSNSLGIHLASPRPNPCRGNVALDFSIPFEARVELELFDIRGSRVARVMDEWRRAGAHRARFEFPAGTPPGLYFARLRVEGSTATAPVVVAR